MSTFNTVVKFFQDSGMFIYPSILIMALGVAVAIERFIFLNRARSENRLMWDRMLPLLNTTWLVFVSFSLVYASAELARFSAVMAIEQPV